MDNTNKLTEEAFAIFDSGMNCAQAVIGAYAEQLDADKKLVLELACGFGAGMGRLQGTCGAVTGAFMAIGIATCKTETDNVRRKEVSYAMIREFRNKFLSLNNALDCRTLLGVDLNTEEGHKAMTEGTLRANVCKKCIADAITITDELIRQ